MDQVKRFLVVLFMCLFFGKSVAGTCDESRKVVNISPSCANPCEASDSSCCKDLTSALELLDLKNTCVVINETNQYLNKPYNLMNIVNFTITTVGGTLNIYCNISLEIESDNIGISFSNSTNIKLLNLNFVQCGLSHPQVVSVGSHEIHYNISSALHFNRVRDLTLGNVIFTGSFGYSVHLHDCSHHLDFRAVTFDANTAKSSLGSGLMIAFSEKDPHTASNNIITINSCQFKRNINIYSFNDTTEQNGDIDSQLTDQYALSFGNGGGFSLFLASKSQNNSVLVNDTTFKNNSGIRGGGAYLRLNNLFMNNTFLFSSCVFEANIATYAGAGVYVEEFEKRTENNVVSISDAKNNIKFRSCTLRQNKAYFFGGGFHYRGKETRQSLLYPTSVLFSSSDFSENQAVLGFALNVILGEINFQNSTVSRHGLSSFTGANSTSSGSVYLYKSKLNINESLCTFSSNEKTAVVLDSSLVYVFSTVNFRDNKGSQGGAIAMYGRSFVKVWGNGIVNFTKNDAVGYGGAVYVDVPGPVMAPVHFVTLNRYPCFFNVEGDGHISFQNNTAEANVGHDIYATTLQNCRFKDADELINVFNNSSKFSFSSNKSNIIGTKASFLDVGKPDDWSKPPGILERFYLSLYDERNNKVSEAITILSVTNNVSIIGNYNKFIVPSEEHSFIQFQYAGNVGKNFDLEIFVPGTGILPRLLNLTLSECSFGYSWNTDKGICICDAKKLRDGISQCFKNNVYVLKDHWGNGSNYIVNTAYKCPKSYCRKCSDMETITGAECLFNGEKQCSDNRSQISRLCSECKSNFSIHLNGSCRDCSDAGYHYIWKEAVHFLGVLCIILILLILNTHTYASYINPIFYSYQIFDVILPDDLKINEYIATPLIVFGGTFNHPWYDICYWDKMNDLSKYWISFMSILYWPLGFLIWYGLFVVLKNKMNWLKEKSFDIFYRVFNTIYLVLCCTIFKYAFSVMNWISIKHDNTSATNYVYIYAKEEFGSNAHIIILCFGAIPLFFIIFIISPIIAFYAIRRRKSNFLDNCCGCYRVNQWLQRPFEAGFKTTVNADAEKNIKRQRSMSIFSLFYIVSSFVVMALAIFLYTEPYSLTMINFVSLILFLIFVLASPYRDVYANHVNSIMQANVILLVASIDAQTYPDDKHMCGFIQFLLLVPFCIFVLHIIYELCTLFSTFPNLSRYTDRKNPGNPYLESYPRDSIKAPPSQS